MKMTQITISEVSVHSVPSIPKPVITGYFWSVNPANSNVASSELPEHTIRLDGKFYSPKEKVCAWMEVDHANSVAIEKDGKFRKATTVTLGTGEKYLRAKSGGAPEVTFGHLPISKPID